MRIAVCELESISPYSQSAPVRSVKAQRELHDEFEKRTWPERINADDNGVVYIPGMAFKNALTSVASYLSVKVPGKGTSTYTKHFTSGVVVPENVSIGIKKDDVRGVPYFVPSDGKRGGGKRVWRTFPQIQFWTGILTVYVLDDIITREVFEEHLRQAGNFIGVGRFRPQNNGFFGRFKVNGIEWQER